ncbi:hypothetical protein G7Z17_g8080 [Cylindrodendrum hubeiense]|uniref:Uncharacterized protein n=1 Tax=Cylindrodendrum hubeiense TaxID=595255 RepID=A0A9P5H7R9_9HYPO|nr:hypothetical protein G7Z17_g8080 [Cylindrodendrum hubeiense]
MFFAACLCGLVSLPAVRADSWDDFSNNLATDLAPFLSLFGEQLTKQYLSESITWLDYFIFAMAPMGILTAVVSAIRVCGSPSLRAFIGRAQEGGGTAEAELCSSTSRDVCELYNNGGIARVFGRPKILEVVYDPNEPDFNGAAGIYRFREYLSSENGKVEWEDKQKDKRDTEKNFEPDVFAPNLSLNVGIKRQHQHVFWAVAIAGLILQAGVLVFAVVVTYCLKWEKDGIRPDSYACPLVIVGTLFVSKGIFLCAYLVGQSTKEQVFRRKSPADKGPTSSLYWVQPGGQVLGDQMFDPFCCSDQDKHLDEYIISWKNRSENWNKNSELAVWAAVGTTISGFVLQFVGLRGIHSAVSVAQLGAIMVMSAARAALRMQRLKPEDNFLRRCPDEVVGHELDWLALTQSANTETRSTASAHDFDAGMVEVRENAQRLAQAIESAATTIFSKSPQIRKEWKNAESMYWGIACDVASTGLPTNSGQRKDSAESGNQCIVYLHLRHQKSGCSQPLPVVVDEIIDRYNDIAEWVVTHGSDVSDGGLLWAIEDGLMDTLGYLTVATSMTYEEKGKALCLAAKYGWTEVVYVLLELGAEPDFKDPDENSRTALSHAAESGNIDIMNALMDGGAFPNSADARYRTPLSYASEKGHDFAVDILLGDQRVEPDTKDHDGFTPLWRAVWKEHEAVVKLLLDTGKVNLDVEDGDGGTPLSWAAANGNEAIVKLLIEKDANIEAKGKDGHTPLSRAAAYEHEAIVKLLIENGADVEVKEKDSWTPLSWAASEGHTAIVKLLIEMGADIEVKEEIGRMPLSWAADHGHEDIVKLLIENGADVERKNQYGETPLSKAAMDGDEAIFKLLIKKGANPMAKGEYGRTLLTRAVESGNQAIVELLIEKGVDIEEVGEFGGTPLLRAASRGRKAIVKLLIEKGANIEAREGHEYTPLLQAAEDGNKAIAKLLIKKGADVNVKDQYDQTPLSHAASRGHKAMVKLLLAKGADLEVKDQWSRTALLQAAGCGKEAIVRLLIRKGADVETKDDNGRTPLERADLHGHMDIVKLLQSHAQPPAISDISL